MPFAFVQPPGGWGPKSDEELAEWIRSHNSRAFEAMDALPDDLDEKIEVEDDEDGT